jgi:CheY-like chemotaxis protein
MRSFVVLVVDDDRNTLKAAVSALEREGYRVLTARSGGEAMAALDRHAGIDLVFTEVVMPGIGGFMLADLARVRRPDIKVLYTSAFAEIGALKVERLTGAFLPKPVEPAVLCDAVGQALRAAAGAPLARRPLPPGRPRTKRSPSLGF